MELNEKVTTTNASPRVLTVSMVYRELDAVQCHLFWNGQMHRFCPNDEVETATVLTDIFHTGDDSQFGEPNRTFLKSQCGQNLLQSLKERIKDREFAYFRRMAH